ncbi:MAG TPA: alginate lyase family protein [bacterium]|nr:alginate lyase family protein [bacterium]
MKTVFFKLKKMSAKEVIFRLHEKGYKKHEKWSSFFHRNGSMEDRLLNLLDINVTGKRLDRSSLLDYMKKREKVSFFFDKTDKKDFIEVLEEICPGIAEDSRRKADLVCKHNFSFLGINPKYDGEVYWTKDPVSLKPWPMSFYTDIDCNSNYGCGDVKHVWELNRHQFFVDLGKAYWLTSDEKYAEKFFGLINNWIDLNSYKIGVNWTSALELAVRSISWIWAFYFCRDSKHLNADINLKILTSLYQHGEYIYKHLSAYSSPYNHLIGEVAALCMIGTLFPEFKESKKWSEKGWNILESEISRQFHQDGSTVEQATFYHHFTLGFYLMAAILSEKNGGKVSEKVWRYIEKAIEFSMYITKPDGKVPMIGDVDSARSIYIENPPPWDFRAFLSTGAVLFNREDMKMMSGGFKEDPLWLLGTEGFRKFNILNKKEPEASSVALKNSGYYIMRSDWGRNSSYLCFDCGEQAAGIHSDSTPSAAHGHADFLSIELAAYGKSFLVDPGLYIYNGMEEWRDYFRKTMAHNTAVVDGKDQSVYLGSFDWSNVANAKLEDCIFTDNFDYVKGSHDGYARLDSSVIHSRSIFYKKHEYWIINDYFYGNGTHNIDIYWHFTPGELSLNEDLNAVFTCFKDNNNLLIQSVNPTDIKLEILSGGSAPSDGWIAPGYGVRLRAPIAKYSATTEIPCSFYTILFPFREKCDGLKIKSLQAKTEDMGDVNGFEIVFNKYIDGYIFNTDCLKNLRIGNIHTNASFLHYRKNSEGEYCEISLIHSSFLQVDDQVYLDVKKPIQYANILNIGKEPVVVLPD